MSTLPRVLQFTPGFRFGGIEALLMGLYRCLDRRRLQFDFMVDTCDDLPEFEEIRAAGGRVFQMGRYLDSPVRYQRRINAILRKHGGEYVALHSHTVIRALPVLWASRSRGITRRILHSHTDSYQGAEHKQALLAPVLTAVTLPFATEYCACSDAAGRFVFGKKPFRVFRNTIRTRSFEFSQTDRDSVRRDLGIREDAVVVGHTGRFTYQKNHEFLIRVFAEFRKTIPSAHLMLVGEGPLESMCRALASELGVATSTSFVGLQSQVAPFLSAMDLFLLPSHFEGFCISLLEAQANGLPCLAASVIHPEVKLTPSVALCDLGAATSAWSNKLLQLRQDGRADSSANRELIRQAGFDTESELDSLLKTYYS